MTAYRMHRRGSRPLRLLLWAPLSRAWLAAILLGVALFSDRQLPVAQADEPSKLRNEIEQLKEGQAQLRQELEAIKRLLLQREQSARVRSVDIVLDIRDAPVKGDRSAPITVVEFADYQCPFCARHVYATLPLLEREYIQTGKIRYAFLDFPLESIHKEAFRAAEAANCAAERGRFWQMHDRLFANQRSLGTNDLRLHAEAVGIDAQDLEPCLSSGKYAAKIRRDMAVAQKAGVQSTPTFLIGLTGGDGRTVKATTMVVGAQPYTVFRAALDSLLPASK